MAKFRFLIIIFLNLVLSFSYGQTTPTTPYYQLPKNRKNENEIINLPNLSYFAIKYYFGMSGGFYKSYSNFTNESSVILSNNQQAMLNWEAYFGQNRDNNYYFEVGIVNIPFFLTTNLNGNFFPVNINKIENGNNQFNIHFRLKKRIFTLDRVAKNAFINVGFATGYKLNKSPFTPKTDSIRYNLTNVNPTIEAIENFKYTTTSKFKPLNFELMIELKGVVTPRFELGLFFKGFYNSPQQLTNTINFNYRNKPKEIIQHSLSNLSFSFGIQTFVSSPKFLKYKSKVE
jgi:hypothetical protein